MGDDDDDDDDESDDETRRLASCFVLRASCFVLRASCFLLLASYHTPHTLLIVAGLLWGNLGPGSLGPFAGSSTGTTPCCDG